VSAALNWDVRSSQLKNHRRIMAYVVKIVVSEPTFSKWSLFCTISTWEEFF
jgi:hypothetical protein